MVTRSPVALVLVTTVLKPSRFRIAILWCVFRLKGLNGKRKNGEYLCHKNIQHVDTLTKTVLRRLGLCLKLEALCVMEYKPLGFS